MLLDLPQRRVESLFSDYLATLGISPKTFKNYKSDISHFTGWLILRMRSYGAFIQELSDAVPFLSSDIASEYKNFLLENKVPVKTLNRRLSTLRHLSRFFLESQILDFDFMEGLSNINTSDNIKGYLQVLLVGFQKHLEAEKVSKSTLKNYLSDTRQFLDWLNTKS